MYGRELKERRGHWRRDGGGSSISSVYQAFRGRQEGREVMNTWAEKVKGFLRSEDGPTTTEYAVMLALIIMVCLAAITLIGGKVSSVFTIIESGVPDGT
jgi:pilus assembly protein Flp/PilA